MHARVPHGYNQWIPAEQGPHRYLLEKQISYSAIGQLMGVHRVTVKNFVESRGLKPAHEAGSVPVLD